TCRRRSGKPSPPGPPLLRERLNPGRYHRPGAAASERPGGLLPRVLASRGERGGSLKTPALLASLALVGTLLSFTVRRVEIAQSTRQIPQNHFTGKNRKPVFGFGNVVAGL